MAQPLTVPFPPNLVLTDGWVVKIVAVDAATGAAVSGVKITEALMQVEVLSGSVADLGNNKWIVNPVLVVTSP